MAIATLAEFASFAQKTLTTDAATLALSIAESLIVGEIGVVTYPAVVKGVQLMIAIRLYNNPNGFTSEVAGARSYSYGSGFSLLGYERALLHQSIGRSGVYSVPLVTPADRDYPYTA